MGECMNNDDIYELAQRDLETTLEKISKKVTENNENNTITRAMYDYNELGEKCDNFAELEEIHDQTQQNFEGLQKELTSMRSFLDSCEQTHLVHLQKVDADEILNELSNYLAKIYKRKLANSDNFNINDLIDYEIIYNS
jgi:hypothetical protein